ncbi:cation/H(+) antiporter 15-like [Nymphaea colorata]|nr:cation/H(+) antiporter 15-like [Nymphaea colorata]
MGGDMPLDFAFPLFVIQISVVLIISRTLCFLLRPFKQPRVVAEILTGILLGPAVVGQLFPSIPEKLLAPESRSLLETFANLGLIYWLFLVGIHLDLGSLLKKVGMKAVVISIAGTGPPCAASAAMYLFLREYTKTPIPDGPMVIFLGGVVLSVSSFPILARMITELKLLNSEAGNLALSSSIIVDIVMWAMLVVSGTLTSSKRTGMSTFWGLTCGVSFVMFLVFVVQPAIAWIVKRTPEGETMNEAYICLILVGVLACAFVADSIGLRASLGAFAFGVVIPPGPLANTVTEKVEDITTGLFLPLFFCVTGLRADMLKISTSEQWPLLVVLCVSATVKAAATWLVAVAYELTSRDGVLIALLMNTKGVLDIVMLNRLFEKKALSAGSYAVMVLTSVTLTAIISPATFFLFKRVTSFIPYKHRTVQREKMDSELRILSCVYNLRCVPTIINLLEASCSARRSPIYIYALRLVQLTGRASMLIVHTSNQQRGQAGRAQDENDRIITAFEKYHEASGIPVQALTSISPYSTMHEDICGLAEEKRIALIILPFHKQLAGAGTGAAGGGADASNASVRNVNHNVLATAPCSVGILVDRGLTGTMGLSSMHVSHHVALLFFGGPDDREALCYSARFVEHEGISLTIMRFIAGSVSKATTPVHDGMQQLLQDEEVEKEIDEEFLSQFRLKTVCDSSIMYNEAVIYNGEEMVAAIKAIESNHDLFIVGRNQKLWESPVTSGLTEWSECPELGPVGDLLASSDFTAASVLVIQQHQGRIDAAFNYSNQVKEFVGNAK